MKYLHVWPKEKFTNSYIEFINENFDKNEHLFLILDNGNGFNIVKEVNVIELNSNLNGYLEVLRCMYKTKQIYIHSFFAQWLVGILFLNPLLLKKSRWIIWGGDLYAYKLPKVKVKQKLYEYIRKKVIKDIGHIIALVKGDFDLAVKWYKTKAVYHYGIYIDNSDYESLLDYKADKDLNEIYIQIGNSGDPTNQHLEAMNLLSKFKDYNIRIFVPLSYGGNKEYRDEIIRNGFEIFGNKFEPMLYFMTKEEYCMHLASIDIALFNNSRQQGLGNIWPLLYLGKKVFIRSDSTIWPDLTEIVELDVLKIEEIVNFTFEKFSKIIPNRNREKIIEFKKKYDPIVVWEKIFKYEK